MIRSGGWHIAVSWSHQYFTILKSRTLLLPRIAKQKSSSIILDSSAARCNECPRMMQRTLMCHEKHDIFGTMRKEYSKRALVISQFLETILERPSDFPYSFGNEMLVIDRSIKYRKDIQGSGHTHGVTTFAPTVSSKPLFVSYKQCTPHIWVPVEVKEPTQESSRVRETMHSVEAYASYTLVTTLSKAYSRKIQPVCGRHVGTKGIYYLETRHRQRCKGI